VSNINFTTINENFPVAGEDNDTQVFRDNFDSIKTALSTAKTEITDLEDNVSRRDQTNDFNGNVITNAELIFNTETVLNAGILPDTTATSTIDFENGNYQIFTITASTFTFDFLNFPTDGTKVGKVTVELYGNDSSSKSVNFSLSGSGATTVKSDGFPGYASGNPIITLASATDAVIIEIWRHTETTFFMKYVGEFA
jgi:hypothetical protein